MLSTIILNVVAQDRQIKKRYIFAAGQDKATRKRGGADEEQAIPLAESPPLESMFEGEITLDELNSLSTIEKVESQQAESVRPATGSSTEYIKDVYLYPHDTIFELKNKIALATGIPIYKQHLWYEHGKKSYALHYSTYINNKAINVNFGNISASQVEYIDNIPILVDFYNVKKYITTHAHDAFAVLEDFQDKLGVREINLLNMDDVIIRTAYSDVQLDMIYYGFVVIMWPMITRSVWTDYCKAHESFDKIYPDLALHRDRLRKIYATEHEITAAAQEFYLTKNRKELERDLFMAITYTTIQITTPYTRPMLNLRNLFDKLEMDPVFTACKCSMLHEGRRIIMNKVLRGMPPVDINIPLQSLMLRVQTGLNAIDIFTFNDGNMTVRARWPQDKLLNFNAVFVIVRDHVNMLIDVINGLHGTVLKSAHRLEKVSHANSRFSELQLSLIYRKETKYHQFKALEDMLKKYESGGLVRLAELLPAENSVRYYFQKGMYKFDASHIEKAFMLVNQYAYLSNAVIKQKWTNLFTNSRTTTIAYQYGDVLFSIEGIKEAEFNTFYMYVLHLLSTMRTAKHVEQSRVALKQSIKMLKHQDQVLYSFKSGKDEFVYSKICQKAFQPVMMSEGEYSRLSEEQKRRAVKYWNFTTNKEVYYFCPNAKYPHIQFTVKRHPKDYCIPCCKIKPVNEASSEAKKLIYRTCLRERIYKQEKAAPPLATRYVMGYGKFIEPGRIANLPEHTIEPLFYRSFSETNRGTDQDCIDQNRYYVYGITQDTQHAKSVGYVVSLAMALEMTVEELVAEATKRLNADPSKFGLLLGGDIYKHFFALKNLTTQMHLAFMQPLETKELPWNEIFMDVAYYYFGVLTFLFVDTSTITSEHIRLLLTDKIQTVEQIMNPSYRSLFVIKKRGMYNPIFYLHAVAYFKFKIIEKRLFVNTDETVQIMQRMISFETADEGTGRKHRLSNILEFTESVREWRVHSFYINKNNYCYYVVLAAGHELAYVPVREAPYVAGDQKVIYEPLLLRKAKMSLSALNKFVSAFNHWIATTSEIAGSVIHGAKKTLPVEQRVIPIYEFINVDSWLVHGHGRSAATIGFRHGDLHYYHDPMPLGAARKLSNKPAERVLYHPDDVNLALYNRQRAVMDPRVRNISLNTYEYCLYELLMLEMTKLFNADRNKSLRKKIKLELVERLDKDAIATVSRITELIGAGGVSAPGGTDDIAIMTAMINDYITVHHDMKMLIAAVDNGIFDFDRLKINEMRAMKHADVFKQFMQMAKQAVSIVPEREITRALCSDGEFGNILAACSDADNLYCRRGKLMITERRLRELMDIMAADLLNPFKQRWMFNALFTMTLAQFRFERRPTEIITVEAG